MHAQLHPGLPHAVTDFIGRSRTECHRPAGMGMFVSHSGASVCEHAMLACFQDQDFRRSVADRKDQQAFTMSGRLQKWRCLANSKMSAELYRSVVERSGRMESTTVGDLTTLVSLDSIWNCARLSRSAMRFSLTSTPRAASMRLRMAASSASLAACARGS